MNFRDKFKPQEPGFQMAPMIDVIFILLSFFIATQIFSQWETEVGVTLPTAKTGQIPERGPTEVIVNVLQDGTIVVNQQQLDGAGLKDLLTRIVTLFDGQEVVIRADERAAYGHVVKVLDLCRQCDIQNIAFATAFPEDEK